MTTTTATRDVNQVLPDYFFEDGRISEEYAQIAAGLSDMYNDLPESNLDFFITWINTNFIPESEVQTVGQIVELLAVIADVLDNLNYYLSHAGGVQELLDIITMILAELSEMAAKTQMFAKVNNVELKRAIRDKEIKQGKKQIEQAILELGITIGSIAAQCVAIGCSERNNVRSLAASKEGVNAQNPQPVNTDVEGEPDAAQVDPVAKKAEADYFAQRSQLLGQVAKVVSTLGDAINGARRNIHEAEMKFLQAAMTELRAISDAFSDRQRSSDKNQDQVIQMKTKIIEALRQYLANEMEQLRTSVRTTAA